MRLNLLLCFVTTVFAKEFGQESIEFWKEKGRQYLDRHLHSPQGKALLDLDEAPKNIILFIGDGMGIATVTAARVARSQDNADKDITKPFFFENFPFSGLVKTASYDTHTTDSAASAVAITSGRKVEQDTLGRKPGFGKLCEHGEEAKIRDGVADLAVEKGYDVGFATTASITDATPGALYAKDVYRRSEFDSAPGMNGSQCVDIAAQILAHPANKFKIMMGGGHAQYLPNSIGGNRTDDRNIEDEWKALQPEYRATKRVLLTDLDEFSGHKVEDDQQVLGLFAPYNIPYHKDDIAESRTSAPRLWEMAVKAIQVLQKQKDSKGYFLMIEGALIDKAEHMNKFHLATEELNEFDLAIEKVTKMVGNDTLILVTADHAHALTLPGYTKKDHSIFDRDGEVAQVFFVTGPGFSTPKNYTLQEAGDIHFAQPTTHFDEKGRHGGEDVGIWSHGPFSWLFSGGMENTQIAYNIKYLLCLDDEEPNLCDLRKSQRDQRDKLVKAAQENEDARNNIFGTSISYKLAAIVLLCVAVAAILAVIVLSVLLCLSRKKTAVTPSDKS